MLNVCIFFFFFLSWVVCRICFEKEGGRDGKGKEISKEGRKEGRRGGGVTCVFYLRYKFRLSRCKKPKENLSMLK